MWYCSNIDHCLATSAMEETQEKPEASRFRLPKRQAAQREPLELRRSRNATFQSSGPANGSQFSAVVRRYDYGRRQRISHSPNELNEQPTQVRCTTIKQSQLRAGHVLAPQKSLGYLPPHSSWATRRTSRTTKHKRSQSTSKYCSFGPERLTPQEGLELVHVFFRKYCCKPWRKS